MTNAEWEASEIVASARRNNSWIPACGGLETPTKTRSGKVLLYCWNPGTGKHAYLDCGNDLILTDDEAAAAIGLY